MDLPDVQSTGACIAQDLDDIGSFEEPDGGRELTLQDMVTAVRNVYVSR